MIRMADEDVLPGLDRIQRYVGEMTDYMRSQFPMRFYHGEKWSTVYGAASLLRLADMADSALAHMPQRRDRDAEIELRSMYELTVTLAWVLIDPSTRLDFWKGQALIDQLALHNDMAEFGEAILDPNEIEAAKAAAGFPDDL